MTTEAKQKILKSFYILLAIAPVIYLLTFTIFLYYTGNGFFKELNYDPQPGRKQSYLFFLRFLLELDNFWLTAALLWILLLIIKAFFFRKIIVKPWSTITSVVFIIVIYLGLLSRYGAHEGWLEGYFENVREMAG